MSSQSKKWAEELRNVQLLQQDRAQTYTRFNDGFKKLLLEMNDAKGYQELVTAITADFSRISTAVRDIESSLRADKRDDLADLLRRIQDGEKAKLMATASIHVKKHVVKTLERADEFVEPELEYELAGLTKELQSTIGEINETLEEVKYALAELLGTEAVADDKP